MEIKEYFSPGDSWFSIVYPVYKGTYERSAPAGGPETATGRETLIQDSKDLGRSIDYLETRTDSTATGLPSSA